MLEYNKDLPKDMMKVVPNHIAVNTSEFDHGYTSSEMNETLGESKMNYSHKL